MTVRLPKPLIAMQMETVEEYLHRIIDGYLNGLFVFGPTGIGKSKIVANVYAKRGRRLKRISDATLHGMRTTFMESPSAHFWLDDFDRWMSERPIVNLFKEALIEDAVLQEATNARTMADGPPGSVDVDLKLIVTSNADVDALTSEQRNHVAAVTSRGRSINISSDPLELLKLLDWWIVEQNYFETQMFRSESKLDRRLSLREIQDVLAFLHTYAWRCELSLRFIRQAAVERIMSPETWEQKLIAGLQRKSVRNDTPPPAPIMFGRNEREGLPAQPTGYERRQAKRQANLPQDCNAQPTLEPGASAPDPEPGQTRLMQFFAERKARRIAASTPEMGDATLRQDDSPYKYEPDENTDDPWLSMPRWEALRALTLPGGWDSIPSSRVKGDLLKYGWATAEDTSSGPKFGAITDKGRERLQAFYDAFGEDEWYTGGKRRGN